MNDRDAARTRFLEQAGWGAAAFHPIAGDASFRHYARLVRGEQSAILMDAPPESEPVGPFLQLQHYLLQAGLRAPRLLARDEASGFLLLEDFGDDSYTRVLRADPSAEKELYLPAIDALVEIHKHGLKQRDWGIDEVPPYDWHVIRREAALLGEWLLPMLLAPEQAAAENERFLALVETLYRKLAIAPAMLVHRDYHADNLFWLPEAEGIARVGMLDFQDGLRGSIAYDMVSLLEDARRDVSPETVNAAIAHYLAQTGLPEERFRAEYAFFGMQRNAKILGIFARLWRRDGKPRYLDYLPRVWAHFAGDLEHPLLLPVKEWAAQVFTPERVALIHQPERLRTAA